MKITTWQSAAAIYTLLTAWIVATAPPMDTAGRFVTVLSYAYISILWIIALKGSK